MAEAKEIVYDPTYMALLDGDDAPITDDFDPDADYNRPMPPIEDGWYYGKVTNAGVYVDGNLVPFRESQWKNESRKYHEVGVKAEIVSIDPLYSNKHVYTDMPLRTKPDPDRNNASGISGAYRALAGTPITGVPGVGHVKQFIELLSTEPMAKFRVQNVLRDRDEEKLIYEGKKAGTVDAGKKNPKAVYGQKKIMALKGGVDSKGKFTGAADHPETGTRCAARAYLVEFAAKDSDKPVKE